MSKNFGLLGGYLEPRPQCQVTYHVGQPIHQFKILVAKASELMAEGYAVDATRLLDVMMDWRETGECPTREDLDFLT